MTLYFKKHRHRVGLLYFVGGLTLGLSLSFFMYASSSSSSSLRERKNVDSKGWKTIDIFYGNSNHIVDNSIISNEYFHRVVWYSQARQDEVVAALLKNKTGGYFIDLAANDPIKISNTYALETHWGWTGLCLEPNNAYWAGLAYRKCQVVGAVIGKERDQQVWFRFPNRVGPQGGIVGEEFDNKKKSKFEEDRPRYTVTLLEIFERFRTPSIIDYMSLDVEGAEELIMMGFPFDKYRFKIITLERPSPNLESLLSKNGYKFWKILKKNSGDTLWFHSSVENQLDWEAASTIDTMRKYKEQ